MISNWFNKLKIEDHHPAEEVLIACIDGELSTKQAAKVRRHLENCWSCRARLDEIEDTINLFVNFRNQIQNPLVEPPPNKWNNFERSLEGISAEVKGEKIAPTNQMGFRQKFRRAVNFSGWSPVQMRFGIGATASLLIVALVWQLVSVRNVSANEVLENVAHWQAKKINSVSEPVVYQKLRFQRAGAKPVALEIWSDTVNSRFRQAVASESGERQFIPAVLISENKSSLVAEPVLQEIAQILQLNRMNPQSPLSASSFQFWRNSLTQKSDEIEMIQTQNGSEAFNLKTMAGEGVETGRITRAVLTVRSNDWHPERLHLTVKNESGSSDYEIIESAFEIVSLPALNPEIFPTQPTRTEMASIAPLTKTSPLASPASPESSPAESASLLTTRPQPSSDANVSAPTAATAELEVEVLRLLNQIGADIGEEATVTRMPAGDLLVQSVVETPQRKAEISRALAPLVGQPGLTIRIETSVEAQRRIDRERKTLKPNKAQDSTDIDQTPTIEIRDTIPADAEVRRYLRAKGTAENLLTQEINRFATRALNSSNQLLLRSMSLKNLANRFSESQIRSLSPDARNKWLILLATRAREVESQSAQLRQELGAVFGGKSGGGEQITASDEAGLKRVIVRLSELASSTDRAVRAAFTFSSGGNAEAVKGAQFWQSLNSIGGLANEIQSAAQRLQNKENK